MILRVWFAIAITFVIAITSLCIAAYRSFDLGFDHAGVIVAALSTLVTTLIGWNIYTIIDVKSIKDDAKKEVEELKKEYRDFSRMMTACAMFDVYKELFEMQARNPLLANGSIEPFIRYGLSYLEYGIDIGKVECSYVVYQIFSDCIKEKIQIANNEQDRIIEIMNRIRHKTDSLTARKILTLLEDYIIEQLSEQ